MAHDFPGPEFVVRAPVQTSRSTAAGCDGESVDDEEKAESRPTDPGAQPNLLVKHGFIGFSTWV